METLKILLFFSLGMISTALTVEEAWKNYHDSPLPPNTPAWIEKIKTFEEFKQRWDRARQFNDKYATTEDAWIAYKALFRLNYLPEEDSVRLELFRKNWDRVLAHNERYAKGEVYYPLWIDAFWQETDEERMAREKMPLN